MRTEPYIFLILQQMAHPKAIEWFGPCGPNLTSSLDFDKWHILRP
jgi:hypothetical protein